MRADLWITADVTQGFASGQNTYNDSTLLGYDFSVELRGTGSLQPNSEIEFLSTGGFRFINGYIIQPFEVYVIHFVSTKYQPVESSYSNGFDINKVLPALKYRIGWRQPSLSDSPVISADNKRSDSGRYFQGFHAALTIKNLFDSQENSDISENDFNTYLSNLKDDAIMRILNEIFRQPELIEQKLMYTRFGTMDILIVNSGMFVGYIVNIANDYHYSTQINTATIYVDSDCSFNLYLFMDGIKKPLQVIPVTAKAYERTIIEFDNLVIPYQIGRKFYFGYFQSELGSTKAIREQVDVWAVTKCFEAFVFTAPAIENNTDFNHNYRQYGYLPYGLNLEISSFRDHTQKILRKTNLFDEAIGLTVAIMGLEQIITSTRSNITERQTKEIANKLYLEVNQAFATKDAPINPGLKARLADEYKRLYKTFFPDEKATSFSMEGDRLGIESSWFKQNYRQLSNPPIQTL